MIGPTRQAGGRCFKTSITMGQSLRSWDTIAPVLVVSFTNTNPSEISDHVSPFTHRRPPRMIPEGGAPGGDGLPFADYVALAQCGLKLQGCPERQRGAAAR